MTGLTFTRLILSLSRTAERTMVTTGQAKMMQSESGTARKRTELREAMTATAPVRPAGFFIIKQMTGEMF